MKKIPRFVPVTAAVLAASLLTACVAPAPVYHTSRYPYQPAAPYPYAQQGAYVETGHIANIEVLRSESAGYGTSGGGAVAGGVLGGVVGNQFGRGGGRGAATALGVVGGVQPRVIADPRTLPGMLGQPVRHAGRRHPDELPVVARHLLAHL